ncbi:hypothetical protein [Metabacillus endolithicus]|uniref:hypothetical protein n=1 Tax=Metabacillus endolithicus TaxID=1535204 RepID=UPI001FF95204|nr:hypothetical protein [Metabacillus endolithicus]UPG61978.1 hypothetical protein MVE64_15410 [Metabacillus endolithicus]
MKSTEKKLLNAMNHIKLHSNPPEHLEERIFNKVAPKRLWRLNKVQLSVASAVLVLFFAGGITSAKMSGFFSWNKGMTYQTYETGQIRENVPTPPEILQQSLEQGKKTYNLTEAYSVADYQILRPAKELLPLKNSIGVSTDQPPEGYYPATFILWDVFENRKHNVYVPNITIPSRQLLLEGSQTILKVITLVTNKFHYQIMQSALLHSVKAASKDIANSMWNI